jgi:DNA-binding transcriptional LysR family regulator
MELRHLRSFLAVARERSFTRAAERLHMAQPPLSQRIRQLEQELGVVLFERHTRRVTLSHAGQVFADEVDKLLGQLEQAVEACRRADRGATGSLRVGYSGRASHLLLPRLIHAFRTRFPDVLLDLVGPSPSGTLRTQLLDDALDVALCFLPLDAPGLATRSLARIEFVLALPATHARAGDAQVPLAALAADPFVAYPSNQGFLLRDAMDAECERAGFVPRVVRESETSQVLLCLVAAGVGASIVPRELQYQEDIAGVVFKPLGEGAVRLSHGMAWLEGNANPALRNLLGLDLGVVAVP